MTGERPTFNFPFLHVPGLAGKPYLPEGQSAYRPQISLSIFGPTGRGMPLVAQIDSGADVCLFHESVADYVGIQFLQGSEEWVRRVGDRLHAGWRGVLAGAIEAVCRPLLGQQTMLPGLRVRYGRVVLQVQAESADGRRLRWRWSVVAGFANYNIESRAEALTGLLGLNGGLSRFQTTFHYPPGHSPQVTLIPYAPEPGTVGA